MNKDLSYFKNKFNGARLRDIKFINTKPPFLSNRSTNDIYLVSRKSNVLTVEDYCKWYSLFFVYDYDFNHKLLIELSYGDILTGYNNSFYPDSVIEFCKENNLKIDVVSYVSIVKMYYEESYSEDILNHLPSINDLNKVLIRDNNAECKYFNLSSKYAYIASMLYTKDNLSNYIGGLK